MYSQLFWPRIINMKENPDIHHLHFVDGYTICACTKCTYRDVMT